MIQDCVTVMEFWWRVRVQVAETVSGATSIRDRTPFKGERNFTCSGHIAENRPLVSDSVACQCNLHFPANSCFI